jgi:LmbE family N-acetylglucosaminyl deacetylase
MSPTLDSMSDNDQKIYALTIVAHPDDESFVFAGTTLQFEEQGKTVAVICATRGEKGKDRLGRDLNLKQMAEIRTKELLQACSILRCDCKKIMDHADGELEQVDFHQLVQELTNEINLLQPQIILTFGSEGISGHRDHVLIGKAAMEACRKANPKPREIWLASIPASKAENFSRSYGKRKIHHLHFIKNQIKGVADEKLMKVDVSKYKNEKLKAIQSHESQYLAHLVWPPFLEHECFEVIKI